MPRPLRAPPRLTLLLPLLPLLALAACGGGGGGTGSGAPAGDVGNYLPLAVGNRWLYQWDEDVALGVVLHQASVEKITGTTLVAGREALVRYTGWLAPGGASIEAHIAKTPTGLVNVLDPVLTPGGLAQLLSLRLPLRAGDRYVAQDETGLASTGDTDGDGQPERIDIHAEVAVLGVETVTVAAGTFTAMKVRTQSLYRTTFSADGSSDTLTSTTLDWYAPGVGRVQSTIDYATTWSATGATDTRSTRNELVAYRVDGASTDTTAPAVTAHLPAASASVSGDTPVSVSFSEHMDPSTLVLPLGGDGPCFTLVDASDLPVPVSSESYSDKTLTVTPQNPLAAGTYTATLCAATDALGNPLPAPLSWSFTVN